MRPRQNPVKKFRHPAAKGLIPKVFSSSRLRSSQEIASGALTTVRRADETDREAIWKVHTRSIRELCGNFYQPHEIAAWIGFRTPNSYLDVIRGQFVFVAEREGEVVGFSQLDPSKGEVEALYILPEAAGTGIGRALLSRTEEEARKEGIERLRLSSTLNAESFYTRLGYRPLGRAKHAINEAVTLDCIRMEKLL